MTDTNARLAKMKADLAEIRADLDKLQARAEQAGVDERARFSKYLDTLDRKQSDIVDAIDDAADAGGDAISDLERGLKEAWQRLAIATSAAEARFN